MKKLVFIVSLLLIISIPLILLEGCIPKEEQSEITEINISVPDGAPALAIAKMLKENSQFEGYNISYSIITGGSTAINAAVNNNLVDILIAPTNLGAILYNRLKGSKDIKLIANVFNSLLYIVGKDSSVESLEQLKGKIVYTIGEGATPDLTFQYILDQKEIMYRVTDDPSDDEIGIQYESDASVLLPKLNSGLVEYAILGEPAVTKTINSFGCYELFSLNDLWNEVTETTEGFPQASFFAIGDILQPEHKDLLNWFDENSMDNVDWVNNNPTLAQETLEDNGWATPVPLNTELISRCNMEYISAEQAKNSITSYLSVLFEMNPISVGGSLPSDDFYYQG
ncbi:MAG: hypothetical protein BWX72_01285 [Firmicutes bacterium ADurb.Bin080]|nr:MAG: hypothetical protein BWX72_01285 [Firmicutes bacterium ADurb.Bin080]